MAEYIDPMKPLIEEFMTEWRIQHDDNVMKAVADVGIVVDKPRLMQALTDAKAFYEEGYRAAMTTANLVEVRHGEWVQIGYDEAMDRITCSCCKEYWNINDNDTETFEYCPNCGAKMDGGKND